VNLTTRPIEIEYDPDLAPNYFETYSQSNSDLHFMLVLQTNGGFQQLQHLFIQLSKQQSLIR
jgi:hypothetical protein